MLCYAPKTKKTTPKLSLWCCFHSLSVAATEDNEKRDDYKPYALVVEYVAKAVVHSNLQGTRFSCNAVGVCTPPIGEPRSLLSYYVEAKILLPLF